MLWCDPQIKNKYMPLCLSSIILLFMYENHCRYLLRQELPLCPGQEDSRSITRKIYYGSYLHPVVYRKCHHDIVWNFDLFIHTRREFKQDPSLGKQSIWNDRLTGAQKSVKHDDHLSIGGSQLATRRVEMWCDHQRGGLNVMLQSLCDMYDMRNTMYTIFWAVLQARVLWKTNMQKALEWSSVPL